MSQVNKNTSKSSIAVKEKIMPKVSYNGSVQVLYKDPRTGRMRSYKGKNKGYQTLFTAIVRALAGKSYFQYVPSMIAGYTAKEAEGRAVCFENIVTQVPPSVGKYNEDGQFIENGASATDDEEKVVRYVFSIPGSAMQSAEDANLTYLTLLTASRELCADIIFSDGIPINKETSLLIYWDLAVGNSAAAISTIE